MHSRSQLLEIILHQPSSDRKQSPLQYTIDKSNWDGSFSVRQKCSNLLFVVINQVCLFICAAQVKIISPHLMVCSFTQSFLSAALFMSPLESTGFITFLNLSHVSCLLGLRMRLFFSSHIPDSLMLLWFSCGLNPTAAELYSLLLGSKGEKNPCRASTVWKKSQGPLHYWWGFI